MVTKKLYNLSHTHSLFSLSLVLSWGQKNGSRLQDHLVIISKCNHNIAIIIVIVIVVVIIFIIIVIVVVIVFIIVIIIIVKIIVIGL